MTYGTIKVDTVTFTDAGIDKSVTLSGLVQNPVFSGNVTVTGTLSGVTVTGTTANFTSGNFTNISGGTHTITSGVFAAGSAASPSITFTGDLNTGIYSPGADQVAISTNSVGRLFVDSSGRVGVGDSTPTVPLDITGSATEGLRLKSDNSSTRGFELFNNSTSDLAYISNFYNGPIIFQTNNTERMRLTSTGLGVGTSSPSYVLDVAGSARVKTGATGTPFIVSTGSDSQGSIRFGSSGGVGVYGIYGGADYTGLQFWTGGVQALTIDNSQRVGVGTSSPSNLFHVSGTAGTPAVFERTSATGAFIALKDSASQTFIGNTNGVFSIQTPGSSYSDKLVVTSAGNVGIGTTTVDERLHVSGGNIKQQLAAATNGGFNVNNGTNDLIAIGTGGFAANGGSVTDGGIRTTNSLVFATGSGAPERARIDSSGRLLVGTSSSAGSDALQQISGVGSSARPKIQLFHWEVGDGAPQFIFSKSRGSSFGSYTAVNTNDELGGLFFQGSNGTTFGTAARIDAVADAAWGANDHPGRLVFSTTADGASSPTERYRITQDGRHIYSNTGYLYPDTDNAAQLGGPSNRFTAVYAVNGSIQTSDRREKAHIKASALGSDFIRSLRPVSYKWIEGGKRDTGKRDEDNNYIYESVPGQRTHWGFIAQEVKQAVDAAGVDFGGWVLTDKNDPDSQQALRYDQFIAPLTKALQEALAEIDVLKAKVAALESA